MQLTEEIRTILEYSREDAMRTGCRAIFPEHLLLGILRHGSNSAVDFLTRAGLAPQQVKSDVESQVFREEPIPFDEAGNVGFSRSALSASSMAIMEAIKAGDDVRAVHLLAALCDTPEEWCGKYLRAHGLDIRIIRSYTKKSSPEKKNPGLPSGEDIDWLLSVFYQDRDIYS